MSSQPVCPNCEQWQHPRKHVGGLRYFDCLNECVARGFAPYFVETGTAKHEPCAAWHTCERCTHPYGRKEQHT